MKRALLLPAAVFLFVLGAGGVGLLIARFIGVAGDQLLTIGAPFVLAAFLLGSVFAASRAMVKPIRGGLASLHLMFWMIAVAFGTSTFASGGQAIESSRTVTIRPNTIYQGSDQAIMVSRVRGVVLRDTVVFRFGLDRANAVELYPETYLDAELGLIALPGGDTTAGEVATDDLHGAEAAGLPDTLRAIAGDLGVVLERLGSPVTFPGWFARLSPTVWRLVFSAVFAWAAMGVWTVLHLTRWRLFNVIAALAYVRLSIMVPRLSAHPWVQDMVQRLEQPLLVLNLDYLVWAFLALVMLVLGIVAPNVSAWQESMGLKVRES